METREIANSIIQMYKISGSEDSNKIQKISSLLKSDPIFDIFAIIIQDLSIRGEVNFSSMLRWAVINSDMDLFFNKDLDSLIELIHSESDKFSAYCKFVQYCELIKKYLILEEEDILVEMKELENQILNLLPVKEKKLLN